MKMFYWNVFLQLDFTCANILNKKIKKKLKQWTQQISQRQGCACSRSCALSLSIEDQEFVTCACCTCLFDNDDGLNTLAFCMKLDLICKSPRVFGGTVQEVCQPQWDQQWLCTCMVCVWLCPECSQDLCDCDHIWALWDKEGITAEPLFAEDRNFIIIWCCHLEYHH